MPSHPPELRAGDLERERTADALREHAAAGRLDLDELEDRLARAYAARTHGELSALSADLPELAGARAAQTVRTPSPGAGRHAAWAGWVALSVLLVAIWALTGAGYFWPVWPILGTAMGAFGGSSHGRGCARSRARPPA